MKRPPDAFTVCRGLSFIIIGKVKKTDYLEIIFMMDASSGVHRASLHSSARELGSLKLHSCKSKVLSQNGICSGDDQLSVS